MSTLTSSRVIENMWRKKALLEASDQKASEIIVDVLIEPGAQLGVYATGQGMALDDMGLLSTIRRIYGISTGIWVAGYLAAGKIRTGAEVYCSDFPRLKFAQCWPPRRFMLDKNAITQAAQFGDNRLNMDGVLASSIEMYAGVTLEDGRGAFVDVKTARPSAWSAFYASSANPLAYSEPMEVNDFLCWDGGIGIKWPMWNICYDARLKPTDLLVLPNIPFVSQRKFSHSIAERVYCETTMRSYLPAHLRQLIYIRKQSLVEDLLTVMYDVREVNVHVLWPPDCGIHEFTMDEHKLRKAVSISEGHTREIFSRYNQG